MTGRFGVVLALGLAALALGAARSSLARDVSVPGRKPPGTTDARASVFESLEVIVGPTAATSCPERFHFLAIITTKVPVTDGMTVTYRWERNDHAVMPVMSETWTGPGPHNAAADWLVASSTGGPIRDDRWMRLHILTPEDVVSNLALVRVRCPARDRSGLTR